MSSLMGGANLTAGSGIRKEHGFVWPSPQYWVFWLYSHRAGDAVVATETAVRHYDVHNGLTSMPEVPNVPYLDVLATRNSTSGDLVAIRCQPRCQERHSGDAAATRILRRQAQVDTLAANGQVVDNLVDTRDAIKPVSSTRPWQETRFGTSFPSSR